MLALVSLFVWLLHNFIIIYSFCTNKCLNYNSRNDELGACVRDMWPSYSSLLKLFSFYPAAIHTFLESATPLQFCEWCLGIYCINWIVFKVCTNRDKVWPVTVPTKHKCLSKKKNTFIVVMTSLKAEELMQAENIPDHTKFLPFYIDVVHYM